MAGPRHLQDPLAHDEKFKALKEEVDEGLEEALSSMFIPGMTISFSGTFGGSDGKRPINPHTGKANEEFALCDGGTYKSPTGPMMTTPDMRGRFVMGASEEYGAGSMGGEEDHIHDITIEPHTLSGQEMPPHPHTFTVGSGIAGGKPDTSFGLPGASILVPGKGKNNIAYTVTTHNTGSGQAHPHKATTPRTVKLPPYYTSAYIMKL